MLHTRTLALTVAAGVLLAFPCSGEMISNGSFETFSGGTFDSGGNRYYFALQGSDPYSSSTALSGWTMYRSGMSSFYSINVGTGLPDGDHTLCLTGSLTGSGGLTVNPEWVSQDFSVEVGNIYTVSYYEKYRQAGGFLDSFVSAALGELDLVASTGNDVTGSGTSTLTQHTLTSSSSWTQYSYDFTPNTDTTVTLTFKTGDSGNYGAFLDEVVVSATPVPEPSAIGLVLAGLGGLLAYARRKRR